MSERNRGRARAQAFRRHRAALLASAIVATAACSSTPEVPPLDPTAGGAVLPGKVVWHDLITPDVDAAKAFYGGLFGWTFRDVTSNGADYALATLGSRPVAGLLRPERPTGSAAEWISFFSVADVDAAVRAVSAGGGLVTVEPSDLAERGRLAVVADPESATFGLLRSTTGDPTDGDPVVNDWLWHELWSNDLEAAERFYGEVFGYVRVERELPAGTYSVFQRGDTPRAGGIRIPQPEIRPTWVPTVRVADIEAAVRRARELGGTIVLEPRPEIRNGKAAIVADPQGAPVTLMEWEGDR